LSFFVEGEPSMGRTALTLLLAGVIAVLLGVTGTVFFAQSAVTSSEQAAKEAAGQDLGQPAGYGSR